MNRGRSITKDYIIEKLFDKSNASAGANNFNVSLSVLRKALDSAAGITSTGESCIVRERDRYRLNEDYVSIDASTFEDRYMYLKKQESYELKPWLELSALFSGTFMADCPYENFLKHHESK
ncbi:MAG: hypothetical protein PUB09_04140 [Firmicutes bacterium]|nr:hypothetical protein [Bacillota bacterium]